MPNKPVDLIAANRVHEVAAKFNDLKPEVADGVNLDTLAESVARQLLCDISHEAGLAKVFAALAATGAPRSLDEIKMRLQSACDAQRREAGQPARAAPSEAGASDAAATATRGTH